MLILCGVISLLYDQEKLPPLHHVEDQRREDQGHGAQAARVRPERGVPARGRGKSQGRGHRGGGPRPAQARGAAVHVGGLRLFRARGQEGEEVAVPQVVLRGNAVRGLVLRDGAREPVQQRGAARGEEELKRRAIARLLFFPLVDFVVVV